MYKRSNLILLSAILLSVSGSSIPNEVDSFASPLDFSNGISSIAIPVEERRPADNYVLAIINIRYTKNNSEHTVVGDQIAKYGEGRILNVTGRLIHVTNMDDKHNHTGCIDSLVDSFEQDLPMIPWIALIERGDCNFEQKVSIAHKNRAVGVIVYNDRDSVQLDKMIIDDQKSEYISL